MRFLVKTFKFFAIVIISLFAFKYLNDLFGFLVGAATLALPFLIYSSYGYIRSVYAFDYRTVCKHCGTKAKEKLISKTLIGTERFKSGEKRIYKECENCKGVGSFSDNIYKVRVGGEHGYNEVQEKRKTCTTCKGDGRIYDYSEPNYRDRNIYERVFECSGCHMQDMTTAQNAKSTRMVAHNPNGKNKVSLMFWWLLVGLIIWLNRDAAMVQSSYILNQYPIWLKLKEFWPF